MELDRNTIDGLLQAMDDEIVNFDEVEKAIEKKFGAIHNLSQAAQNNYSSQKKSNHAQYERNMQKLYAQMRQICERTRLTQPVLQSLEERHINMRSGFPRRIVFGKYRITFQRPGQEIDFQIPRTLPFPLQNPVRIDKRGELPFIHQLLLRLIFTLPVDKQEYYFFDPRGLGSSVKIFNRLFTSERLVPQQKVMMSAQELKDALKHVELYIRDLYTHTFNAGYGENWEEYNRYWYERNERRKMLPYRVFVFMDVPLEMDQDCFKMFRNLLEHNGHCGILVLFSCDDAVWADSKERIRSTMEQELLRVIEEKCIHPAECFSPAHCRRLSLDSVNDEMPSADEIRQMVTAVCEKARTDLGSMFSFSEMLSDDRMFSGKSRDGLELPIGYDTTGGSMVSLKIGDRTPHYLIGGATGSGKSNLLHNLIVSVCWHYDPGEVRVYLLDFKEGVEFNQYALPDPYCLPHAALVATEADTEYGVTVLSHLDEELSRRAKRFKEQGCKDFRTYRAKRPENQMPRILAIIDEFQVLFESAQKAETLERMVRIAKQGRSAGVHLILATQSLKGIDAFYSIAAQFGGRIALKCTAEDSKALLGGISTNNEAASGLEIPYAILNTTQGSVSGNLKFAVPEATGTDIAQKLNRICAHVKGLPARYRPTRIFSGRRFPVFPEASEFRDSALRLTLGRTLSYEENMLSCALANKLENNILFCGHNPKMRNGFLYAVLLSADFSDGCDEIAYVGEDEDRLVRTYGAGKPLRLFPDTYAFAQAYENSWREKKLFVILDNRDLVKEVGFPAGGLSFGTPKETDTAKLEMKAFWGAANPAGSHFVAFFDSGTRIKASGIPLADFNYRVAYEINDNEMGLLTGASYVGRTAERGARALLIENQEVQSVFRPFFRSEWGDNQV